MPRDPDWTLIRSFLAVLRSGSLSAAARRLRLAQPTLGRHIAALEADLGQALFTRAPAGLVPTAAARAMRPMAEAMEQAAAALLRAAEGADDPARGTVRITASEIMGALVLPPILAVLQARHPGLVLELVLDNRAGDLLRRDADIAVRMFRPKQEALLARRLGAVGLGLYAHRDYLARCGAPATVAELGRFHLIGFDRDDASVRAVAGGVLPVERGMFRVRSDSDLAQVAMLRAGLGIGAIQHILAGGMPELVPVLAGEVRFGLELWVAMHEDQRGNAAVRAAFEVLGEGLGMWVGK
jgi:DNA-binding transcriptional LysR family regulator